MTLPNVTCWIIEYRTACSIFLSGSNARIDHCVEKCAEGLLFYCHCEDELFRGDVKMEEPFTVRSNCLFEPCPDVIQACIDLDMLANGQKPLGNDETPVYMAGIAMAKIHLLGRHISFVSQTAQSCYRLTITSLICKAEPTTIIR